MRLPVPPSTSPPEIYEAVIRDHGRSSMRMGEVLMACGWSVGDATRAALDWDLRTLAAAIAHERAKLTMLSEAEVAEIRRKFPGAKKTTALLRPKRTPRIVQRNSRTSQQPSPKPDGTSRVVQPF